MVAKSSVFDNKCNDTDLHTYSYSMRVMHAQLIICIASCNNVHYKYSIATGMYYTFV